MKLSDPEAILQIERIYEEYKPGIINPYITPYAERMEFVSVNDLNNGTMTGIQEWLRRKVTPEHIYIDVGAYIGCMTIPVVSEKKPFCSIAVEPNSLGFPCLEKNVKEFGLDTICLNTVVAGKSGKVRFLECEATGSLTRTYDRGHGVNFEGVSIDDLLAKYNPEHKKAIIKIDVELGEPIVWRGMKKSFPDIEEICIEFFFHGAEDQGMDLGYLYEEIIQDGWRFHTTEDTYVNEQEFNRIRQRGLADFVLKH